MKLTIHLHIILKLMHQVLPLLNHLHVLGTELWDRDNFTPLKH